MNTTVYRLPSFSKKIHQVYYGTRKHCLPWMRYTWYIFVFAVNEN
jgi:hypothetical protein